MSSPQHKVRITQPFYFGEHEVTVGQYRRFLEATNYVSTMEQLGIKRFTWSASAVEPRADERAVIGVSWEDAKAFCKWLSEEEGQTYDLPSEAQWEYACRAGTTTAWSFGADAADLKDHAVFGRPSFWPAEVVGSKAANPFGLFDVHGNADEWCLDWHQRDFYSHSPVDDPLCTTDPQVKGAGRVARGGAAVSAPWWTRSTSRGFDYPATPNNPKGFRIVMTGDLRGPSSAASAAQPTGSDAEIQALRELVAAQVRNRDAAQASFEAGQVPRLDVVAAEIELVEARIRLSEAESGPAGAIVQLQELVKLRTEERQLVEMQVQAGITTPSSLSAAEARLADAKARLAKAEASPDADR
jgi:hypothetical protein